MTDEQSRPRRGSSRYAGDPRVTRDGGGYRLPSDDGDDWRIRRARRPGTGWTATSEHGQAVTDPGDRYNRRLEAFATADDAIGYIIGEPEGTE